MILNCTASVSVSAELTFTASENLFISYIQNIVKLALEQNSDYIIVPTTVEMQKLFYGYAHVKDKTLKRDQLDVNMIVASLWEKARKQVNEEEVKLRTADQISCKHTRPGKVFTRLQASFLLQARNKSA